MDSLSKNADGYTQLGASSLAVGLPEGLMGNSEVGHLNIGAGRVVWQDVVRIDQTIKKGEMATVPGIVDSFTRAKNGNGRLHLLGLVSDGGVHSHIKHLLELLKIAKTLEVPHVFIHFFGDGRDTDPKSAANYMQQLLDTCKELGIGKIATVVGRYYAMDRDKRWDRVQLALDGIISGEGEATSDPVATIKSRYDKGENDEFLKPIIANGAEARVQDNDTLFFFNYRSDRVREIVQLIGDHDRSPNPDFAYPKNLSVTTMTRYNTDFTFPVAFAPQGMNDVLTDWLGKQDIKQYHVAETEKYAHVTFFFNGGVEKVFKGEERDLVPSPKDIATYDRKPEMSVDNVATTLSSRISDQKYEFLMNNFAPPDMVGHTGVYEAAVKGVAATDKAIGKVYEACKANGYVLFITADHGNAEEMKTAENTPKTSHTCNEVPLIMANAPAGWSLSKDHGVLGDVAPTVLATMGLEQPHDMTGRSLLVKS